MKHFTVEIVYTKPIEEIMKISSLHREYLKTGYDTGLLLFSGRRTDQKGGMVVARAESEREITEFFGKDPFGLNNAAEYKTTEFGPVLYQDWMKDWVEGK